MEFEMDSGGKRGRLLGCRIHEVARILQDTTIGTPAIKVETSIVCHERMGESVILGSESPVKEYRPL